MKSKFNDFNFLVPIFFVDDYVITLMTHFVETVYNTSS